MLPEKGKVKKFEQVKAVNNVSCAEAVKRVQRQRGRDERTLVPSMDETDKVNQCSRPDVGQAEEKNTALTVDTIILFIAYVINCTDQVKHKKRGFK